MMKNELDTILEAVGRMVAEGDLSGALMKLMTASAKVQCLEQFQFAKGTLHFKGGQLDDAIVAFENALSDSCTLPEYYSNLGVALLTRFQMGRAVDAQKDVDRAIELLTKALELGPDLPHAYLNLGGAWLQQGSVEKAAFYFELAIERFPTFEPARAALAELPKV